MDFKRTKFSLKRPLWDYAKVQSFYTFLIRGNKFQTYFLAKQKTCLNVGCGSQVNDRFINLDFDWKPGIDLCWDITKRIPLGDNSIMGIYSEHCLEHISFDECVAVLKDFNRLLCPGGTLRIVVPDGGLYLDLYQKNKENPVSFPYPDPENTMTPMMHVNRVFREHGHQFAYDYETMERVLKQAGFVRISRNLFGDGRDSRLLIDSPSRMAESLYVEAQKKPNASF